MESSFVSVPGLAGVVTDTHFGASGGTNPAGRNRMGRLVTFLARMRTDVDAPYYQAAIARGVGINEGTFLLVEQTGLAHVVGTSSVYFVTGENNPILCEPGQSLIYAGLLVRRVDPGTAAFELDTAWDRFSPFGEQYHIKTARYSEDVDGSGLVATDRAGGKKGVY